MLVKFNHIKSFKVINESITTKYAFKTRKIITGEGGICKTRGKFMHVPRMDFKIRKLWETLTTLKAFKICNQRTKIRDSGT